MKYKIMSNTHNQNWIVYILKCCDHTLYTGITNDITRRIQEHESGKGAKYTKGRGPFTLIYTEAHTNRSDASKREWHIKSLDKLSKLKLTKNGVSA